MRSPLMKLYDLKSRRRFLKAIGLGAGTAVAWPGVRMEAADQNAYPDLAQLRTTYDKAGVISPDKTYCMMEWSLHFPPEGRFDFDLETAMSRARDTGAESMMFYAQDCWGYALYPSDTSVRHPHLTYDFFGKQVELARKRGMSAVAYYCIQFNNQVVLNHRDWAWVNEKGEPERERWYEPCMDTPYRQYVLAMIEEISRRYEIDELFLDVFGIQFWLYHSEGKNPFCFCKHTEAAWNNEYPGDPYREGFKTQEGWDRRYQWHQRRTMFDLLDEIIAAARQHRPDLLISLNGGPEMFPDALLKKVSFLYNEPVKTTTGISLSSIFIRGWGRPDYQGGVFTWWPYIDSIPGPPHRVEADALLLQNTRVFFVGETPLVSYIDGVNFSTRWFERAAEAFADVRNVDCLLPGTKPVLSAAMLYSEATRNVMDAQKRPLDFRRSTTGGLELMTYSGRPVESIPEFRLTPELLREFETLVLPQVDVLSDTQAAMIREWVAGGGTLVAIFKCGLLDENQKTRANFALADVLGVDYVSEEKRYAYDSEGKPKDVLISTYMESAGHPLAQLFGKTTVGLPGSFVNVKRITAQEVMRYRLPLMVEDMSRDQWYNWGPPPPGKEVGGTAVAYNRFGKGQAVYIGAPIFQAVNLRTPGGIGGRPFWLRQWFPNLLRQLVPNPIAEVRPEPFSEYMHGTFAYDSSGRFVLVQVLNTGELALQGEARRIPKVHIWVNPAKLKVIGARVVWPKTQDLPVQVENGKTHIVLTNLERYAALYLKLA